MNRQTGNAEPSNRKVGRLFLFERQTLTVSLPPPAKLKRAATDRGQLVARRPTIVDLYSWLEPILCLHALGWSLYFVLFNIWYPLGWAVYVIAAMGASGAVILLAIQPVPVASFLDYTLRFWLIGRTMRWVPGITRMWGITTILRVLIHLAYVVWWTFSAWAVIRTLDAANDVRLVGYLIIALMHLDRLLRNVRGARQ